MFETKQALRAFRPFVASIRLQLAIVRADPSFLVTTVTSPPLYTALFVLVLRHAGRPDLGPFAVIAPATIGVWFTAVAVSAEVLENERSWGTFELLLAAPATPELVMLGRISATTIMSLMAIPECIAVAWCLRVSFPHVDVVHLMAGIFCVVVAAASSALIIANVLLLTRSPSSIQQLLTYPICILSGIAFPVSLLPTWVLPISQGIALSWAIELVRSSVGASEFRSGSAIAASVGLSLAYLFLAHLLFRHIERRIRVNASISTV